MHGKFKGNYYTAVISYGKVYMLESKEKYYENLSNTINNFNNNKKSPLSNVTIQEAILKVMRED